MDLKIKLLKKFGNCIFKGRLGKEDLECYKFATHLRKLTIEGTLQAVWFHVANEYGGTHKPAFGAKLDALGRFSGVADYIIANSKLTVFIEFKAGKNKQQESQLLFEEWCNHCGIKYFLVYGAEEAISLLERYYIN